MISDIPPFDLKLALRTLFAAAEAGRSGWKPAKSLIVVTNGALGLLPLSLLPTAPAEVTQRRRPAVYQLPRGAVAGAHPCGDHGAVGRGAADLAQLPPANPTAAN